MLIIQIRPSIKSLIFAHLSRRLGFHDYFWESKRYFTDVWRIKIAKFIFVGYALSIPKDAGAVLPTRLLFGGRYIGLKMRGGGGRINV
jgi:hypothetical protein